ncbi:MAG: hypothetical protein PHU41_07990 [Sulfuricurvum sp.]|nr:hypothetical protein [Sulfuricurvum sp.]
MALGTSAFAIDNVKVNGEAKLWYQTTETSGTSTAATTNGMDYFNKTSNSAADVKLSVGATADLLQNLSAGVKMTALTTLGLENNLVGATPAAKYSNSGVAGGASALNDQSWVEEAYLAYTVGKTTAKIGRQALNTPLAFTENWNVVDNTFEAAVLLNNDVPDTTLVGAWVGRHNGVGLLQPANGRGTTVAQNGTFSTFGVSGAYAAAAINKSIPNTTVQGWYYNVTDIANAYWLQADGKYFDMVSVGVQYAGMNPDSSSLTLGTSAANQRNTNMYALKAAVDVVGVNMYAAFSSVNKGTLGFANVATGDKTSMYTGLASVYFDGEAVSAPDTNAWKIGASTKLVPSVALSASYAEAKTGDNDNLPGAVVATGYQGAADFKAWDVIAATKVGPVDLTAIYTEYERKTTAGVKTIDNNLFRLIASLKF